MRLLRRPIIASFDCEGTGEVFCVAPSLKFSTRERGQTSLFWRRHGVFHCLGELPEQALAAASLTVYTISLRFRSKRSRTDYVDRIQRRPSTTAHSNEEAIRTNTTLSSNIRARQWSRTIARTIACDRIARAMDKHSLDGCYQRKWRHTPHPRLSCTSQRSGQCLSSANTNDLSFRSS